MTNSERLLALLREREWRVLKIGDIGAEIRDIENDIARLLASLRTEGMTIVCDTWSVLLDDDGLLIDDIVTTAILDRTIPTPEPTE